MKKLLFVLPFFGLVGCKTETVTQPAQPPVIIEPSKPDVIVVPGRPVHPAPPPHRPGIHIDINAHRPGFHCCPGCGIWVAVNGPHHCR